MSKEELTTIERHHEKQLDQVSDSGSNREFDTDDIPPAPGTFAGTAEERALVSKLDKRILPLTCLLYLFACMRLQFCW